MFATDEETIAKINALADYFLLSYDSNIQRKYLEKMGYSVEDIMPYLDVILRVRENEMSCIY